MRRSARPERAAPWCAVVVLLVLLAAAAPAQEGEGFRAVTPVQEGEGMGPGPGDGTPPPGPRQRATSPEPKAETERALSELQELFDDADAAEGEAAEPPPAPAEPSLATEALRVFGILAALLAVLVLATYGVRRLGQRTRILAPADLGTVLGRLYLSPKASLVFVETGGRLLVLGMTPQQITLLTEMDPGAVGAAPRSEDSAADATAHRTRDGAEPRDFMALLRERTETEAPTRAPLGDEDDVAELRGDIERLKRYLAERDRDG